MVSVKAEMGFQMAVLLVSNRIQEWASSCTLIDLDPLCVVSEMASVGITLVRWSN